ncbi:Mechanosensitive ion channel [Desulfatibacillum alkenivorans DSM 16219]|jgi:small-conductance mechanosensitive channel|uniref:Mechanosensitive ion channel n=1 Tax=Desulfatibacillum alkenivorans DSM 16219 TaxID=1121393 RepID=A0A1M6M8M4_9BACT|nr:mechanosensitive ion channel family protein [Desulfatibacillum alkenivorans]SHJ79857.1 Mechanosensitive ion channel [Desulfatibacillum alkenivorans DSM 16219]
MEFWNRINEMLAELVNEHSIWQSAAMRAAAGVLGSLILWMIFRKVVKIVFARLEKYEFIQSNQKVLSATRQALFYGLILATGMYLIEVLGLEAVKNPFFAIMIVFFAAPGKKIIYLSVTYLESRIAGKTETKLDDIVFDITKRFGGVLIYVAAIIFALDRIGINVMPIIAGASVMGVAVGFAAKDTLSNFIAGVLLLIDRPFEVGDRIEVWTSPRNSATWGDVMEIGMRATKIQTTDNITIVIPNNEIMTRDIINYTSGSEGIRVRINMGVAYDADIAKAKSLIINVANQLDWVSKDPAPVVVVVNYGESSVDLQVRVWIDDARKRIHTISYITDKVKEEFDKHGVEIPFPRRDIIIRQGN